MAWVFYDSFKKQLFTLDNSVDFDDNTTTTVKVALVTSTYVPDTALHQFFSDVSANEVSGTNYTAGGNEAATKTVTVASGTVTVDAADPATWAQSATGFSNARYAILYKDTGTTTTSPLIAYHDFGSDVGNTTGDLTVSFDATNGVFTLS